MMIPAKLGVAAAIVARLSECQMFACKLEPGAVYAVTFLPVQWSDTQKPNCGSDMITMLNFSRSNSNSVAFG
jgi:hypothetical protein